MSLEEEHERLHRRGEMMKFLLLVVIMLTTVLVVAAIRPIIFYRVVPAALGWHQPSEPTNLSPSATPTPEATPTHAAPDPPTETAPAPLVPTPTPTIEPSPTPRTYVVQRGDTLVVIAARVGVPLQAIIQANNLTNPNHIEPGQRLLIPSP